MLLKNLKQNMILPTKELIIDKIVKIREIDVHLLSITSDKNKNVLWVMYAIPHNIDESTDLEEIRDYASNKDEMINNVNKEMQDHDFYISEISIQNQKMNFHSSSASRIYEYNKEGYMQLQHFIEKGISTANWDEVNVSNIVIASYEQMEDEEFPEIDYSQKLDITIKIDPTAKQILINQPIELEFREMQKGKKLYFYDSIENKERIFYIDKMESYDIWEETNKTFESEIFKNFSKKKLNKMKKNYLACLKETCPENMNLAMLEYETEDNIQLNFYSKEYLDKKPVHKSHSSFIMFKSDRELGINGFKSRVCMIMPIKKDFNGIIAAELFSYYREIPEEIIVV